MDIGEVVGFRTRFCSLGHAVARADDQVVSIKAELLDRRWEQREEVTVVRDATREVLNERGHDPMSLDGCAQVALLMDERVDGRLRKQLAQHL